MEERKISILNEHNEKLIGIETIPEIKKEKYPAIILVHGFGETKSEEGEFDYIANNFSKIGILVFRFDFSGCGESDGDYCETSLSKLKSDLSKIFEFVKSCAKVDASKIGIFGQSFGTTAIIALEPKVKCIIMNGSISHPKEISIKLFKDGYNPGRISTREKSNGLITKIKPQFWKDFNNHNLLESIKKVHCPILFIHGEKDDTVPVSDMEEYFRVAKEPKQKVIIKGADHGLEICREERIKIMNDWLSRYLI